MSAKVRNSRILLISAACPEGRLFAAVFHILFSSHPVVSVDGAFKAIATRNRICGLPTHGTEVFNLVFWDFYNQFGAADCIGARHIVIGGEITCGLIVF